MNLKCVHVVGFFSLPSASLAEANPTAYSLAVAAAPAGAGSCAHCGTGILHHVIVEDGSGVRSFIGTDCAQRVGDESVRRCVSERKTFAEIAKADAEREELNERNRSAAAQRIVDEARRGAKLADLADRLQDGRNGFCDSVASDLRRGVIPTGRGMTLMVEILAKHAGRRNSLAYNDEVDYLTNRLEEYIRQEFPTQQYI